LRLKHFLILCYVAFGLGYFLYADIIEKQGYFIPSASKIDLLPVLSKTILTDSDYQIIYAQTGIAKPIVQELKLSPDFKNKMLNFQEHYLAPVTISSQRLAFFTQEDFIKNPDKTAMPAFDLAPYKNGYIFFTKSTHTMNWRHGHAGIVVDAKRKKTLEALNPGTASIEQDADKWRYYPTFKMMRLKNVEQTVLNQIALYASTQLSNLPYDIVADKNQGSSPYATHCSLLVWQAFKPFGFDLDATGGLFVSPKNIASSPLLEVLQIYGFNPDEDW